VRTKRYMEVGVCICDFCGKETVGAEWHTCMICGKHICDDCDKGVYFAFKSLGLHLCPECYNKPLKEIAEKASEVYGIRA